MSEDKANLPERFWWRTSVNEDGESCGGRAAPGADCPQCAQGRLAFDALFVLVCPLCGYVAEGGAFT